MSSLREILDAKRNNRGAKKTESGTPRSTTSAASSHSSTRVKSAGLPQLPDHEELSKPLVPDPLFNATSNSIGVAQSLRSYREKRAASRPGSEIGPSDSQSNVTGMTSASVIELMEELNLTKTALKAIQEENKEISKSNNEIKETLLLMREEFKRR